MSVISQFTGVPYSGIPITVTGTNFDCSLGTFFIKESTTEETFTFSNAPANRVFLFSMRLTIGVDSNITWPESVLWQFIPLLNVGTYIVSFLTDNGGTNWVASSIYATSL